MFEIKRKSREANREQRERGLMGDNVNKENEEGKKVEQEKGLSIFFWNVARLYKKYKELERYLKNLTF